MKKLPLLMLLGLVLGLVGCSKVQTTTLLAEKWETGQHRTCLYGHKNLYCFQPGQLEGLNNQQKSQFTPYLMELKRKEALKEPGADGGSYETRFSSHSPMDFSYWDCYKTGAGSPAIACELKQKPTGEELSAFVKTEKEQTEHNRLEQVASNFLVQLEPKALIEACGQGERSESHRST